MHACCCSVSNTRSVQMLLAEYVLYRALVIREFVSPSVYNNVKVCPEYCASVNVKKTVCDCGHNFALKCKVLWLCYHQKMQKNNKRTLESPCETMARCEKVWAHTAKKRAYCIARKFGSLAVCLCNRQIKICQYFILAYICMAIPYRTAKFKSANIFGMGQPQNLIPANISDYTV